MNNCIRMKGRIKRGNYSLGRGYSGWYTTKYNKNVFLRSLQEFVFAKELDFNKIPFLTEQTIFRINKENYKPDFFIYSDNIFKNLIKIIELKNSEDDFKRYLDYITYFKNINVEYELITGKDLRKNYIFCSVDDMNVWRQSSINSSIILSGIHNPMYGMHHTEETKNKIGNKTREYMKDPTTKRKHSENIKAFWNSSKSDHVKKKYRKLRKIEKIKRLELKNILDPIINCNCIICESKFKKRKSSKRLTCSGSCEQKYTWRIGKRKYVDYADIAKKTYRKRILGYMKIMNEDINLNSMSTLIDKYKNNKLIPNTFGLNINIINKYFGNLDNLKLEINNG